MGNSGSPFSGLYSKPQLLHVALPAPITFTEGRELYEPSNPHECCYYEQGSVDAVFKIQRVQQRQSGHGVQIHPHQELLSRTELLRFGLLDRSLRVWILKISSNDHNSDMKIPHQSFTS